MADREEESKQVHQNETKIPVFTVLKNGAILKNIFIVNNASDPQNEEVVILGRHPDCNIMLTHPSISRFHLQIHSYPSSHKLCVVDLSSVHGTWVSGKRIEAGESVEIREGDTLKVGGSSRVYKLHWVPLSSAYDFECPKEKNEEEVAVIEEKAVDDCEKVISLVDENRDTVEDSLFNNIEPLYSDEDWNMEMMKEVTLAPPLGDIEGMVVTSVDDGKNDCCEREQEETSLLSIPIGNELKSLEMSLQPPSLPLSADNLSFNVENIIMSSFFSGGSKCSSSTFERDDTSSIWNIPLENVSRSSLSGKQLCQSKIESPLPPFLPLSAENLSFNVENIIMSSFFDGETKSSSCNMLEWEETSSICTIPLENKSNILSVVDDIRAYSENGYKKLDIENKSPQPGSTSLCKDKSSEIEDIAMIAFSGGEWESSSRNEFEQMEISKVMTIPLEHESSNIAVVDEEKPISDNEHQQTESQKVLANNNLCSNVRNIVETQYLPVHEVKSSSTQPQLALQPQTVTEKNEFMVEQELHPLEDDRSSISSKKGIPEIGIPNKSQTENGKDYVHKGNDELYQVTLNCQSEHKNGSSIKTKSVLSPNMPMNQNIECCEEEKYNARLGTFEGGKSVPEKEYEHKELSESTFVTCASEFYSSLPDEEVSSKIAVKKEIQTPHKSVDANSPIRRSENVSAVGRSIWLRRGKPTSFPRVETGACRENQAATSNERNHDIAEGVTVANTLLFHMGGEEEEEIFTPDKENFTPNTLLMKSLKKNADINNSGDSIRSKSQTSIFKTRHKIKEEEELSEESDKENQTPKTLHEQRLAQQISKNRRFGKEKLVKKRATERVPFQSLTSNLVEKKRSDATVVSSARKSNISVSSGAMKNKYTVEGKKCWTMVVDIDSLLNKESMKSLQLLQGLQGTQLIIPRIVIRELNCLIRHNSLFRKPTEAASILQWIEDCMVKTRWWIHVQSSEENRPHVTPPATPQSPCIEGSSQSLFWRTASSIQSFTQRSFMEALSPTPEDHILDSALHFRRGVNHGQLVLLSDDVTLKVKAMAEGLICETAKEFRESLVNPFSERFLWADSSPRGLTWSCPDDVVLRERYDRCSSKAAERAKGLKLILLHNSQYGMIR